MWAQGEHIALVGDTGSGKTFLLARLAEYRRYDVILRTKDDNIRFPHHTRIRSVRQMDVSPNRTEARYVLDPIYAQQARQTALLFDRVWAEGGWMLGIDETWYVSKRLGLERKLDMLLTQGRSLGISVVCGMQRPAQISRFVLSQCTHLFAFQTEGRDMQTLAEAFTPRLKELMPDLRAHEYLYFNRRTRALEYGYAQGLAALLGRR